MAQISKPIVIRYAEVKFHSTSKYRQIRVFTKNKCSRTRERLEKLALISKMETTALKISLPYLSGSQVRLKCDPVLLQIIEIVGVNLPNLLMACNTNLPILVCAKTVR